jgi:hypothetical protein
VPLVLEKRALQACVAAAGLVAVVAGGWGVLHGVAADAEASNHARYLSGLLLAIGLASWTTLPAIATKARASRFRLLAALVAVGGLCRLLGVVLGDLPSWQVAGALVMELVVTPLLCLWQSSWTARFARQRLATSGGTETIATFRRVIDSTPQSGKSAWQQTHRDRAPMPGLRDIAQLGFSHDAQCTIRFNPLADFLASRWRLRRSGL